MAKGDFPVYYCPKCKKLMETPLVWCDECSSGEVVFVAPSLWDVDFETQEKLIRNFLRALNLPESEIERLIKEFYSR